MTSPRKVDNKNPMRGKMFYYLKEHPQELRYIVGDYLARNKIIQKAKKEVFDNIRNKFNSKHQCSSCDYGIMEFELVRLEKKHLRKL